MSVLVVEQDRRILRRPARRAVGRRQARRVVILTPEVQVQLARQVRLDAIGDAIGEPVRFAFIEVEKIAAAGRHGWRAAPVLQHLLTLTRLQIDEGHIAVGRVPRHLLAVRQVVGADRPRRILRLGHVRKIWSRQLHEPLVREVHDAPIRAIAFLLRPHALHRLEHRILPVPDVHAARRRGAFRRRRRGRRRGADEKPCAVVRESRRRLIARYEPLRHAARRAGYELGRRGVTRLPVVDAVRRHFLVVLRLIAEECQLRTRVVEREPLVVALALVQRDDGAVGHLAREGAVFFSLRRGHGVGEPRSVLRPCKVADQRNRDVLTRDEVADDEIAAVVLALGARRVVGRLPFGRRLTGGGRCRRFRRRAASGATSATAADATAARTGTAPVHRGPCRGLFGHGDTAHALDDGDLSGGEGHDAAGGSRRRVGPASPRGFATPLRVLAAAPAARQALFFFFRLGLRDRERHELRVRSERRVRSARMAKFLTAAQIADDDLTVESLRRQRIREPFAVARQCRPLNRPPRIIRVVGERLLSGDGTLRVERPARPGRADAQHEHAAQRCTRMALQSQQHVVHL